jgi:hypothetical protein
VAIARHGSSPTEASEEASAGARAVLSMTAAVGGMVTGIEAAAGQPLPFVALPTLALVLCIAWLVATERWRDRAVTLAGSAGVGVWLALLPGAHAEAMLAPLAMIVLCLAMALRPDRLVAWIAREMSGRPARESLAEGSIEEL